MEEHREVSRQIGHRVKRARQHKNMTQKELAADIGLTVQAISEMERGISQLPAAVLVKVCKALDVSGDYLLFGKDDFWDPDVAFDRLEKLLSL